MYRSITVDGEPAARQQMETLLRALDPEGEHRFFASCADVPLAEASQLDLAFLETELPDGSGLALGKRLLAENPRLNLIFTTTRRDDAPEAFALYASAFLLKPVTEASVRDALGHLRYAPAEKLLTVRCFGAFELWCGGVPVRFGRSKTKQLFAYLIDRAGAMCSVKQMVCALWPEENAVSYANQVRVFLSDMQRTLQQLGVGEVLIRRRGLVGIDRSRVSCDYYRWLDGDPAAAAQFHGEYMSQYSFGEITLAALTRGTED